MKFWDSSAIVPRLVFEEQSAWAQQLLRDDPVGSGRPERLLSLGRPVRLEYLVPLFTRAGGWSGGMAHG